MVNCEGYKERYGKESLHRPHMSSSAQHPYLEWEKAIRVMWLYGKLPQAVKEETYAKLQASKYQFIMMDNAPKILLPIATQGAVKFLRKIAAQLKQVEVEERHKYFKEHEPCAEVVAEVKRRETRLQKTFNSAWNKGLISVQERQKFVADLHEAVGNAGLVVRESNFVRVEVIPGQFLEKRLWFRVTWNNYMSVGDVLGGFQNVLEMLIWQSFCAEKEEETSDVCEDAYDGYEMAADGKYAKKLWGC